MEHWYVVFAKPHKEALLEAQLVQRGFQAYLPMLPPSRERRRVARALFPRYLFVRLDPSQVSLDACKWIPGLSYIVTFDGRYPTVVDTLVTHIKQRLSEIQQTSPPFQAGERVRPPADHPLSMLDAVFEKTLPNGVRARILIEVLGRLTRREVDMGDPGSIEEPSWSLGAEPSQSVPGPAQASD